MRCLRTLLPDELLRRSAIALRYLRLPRLCLSFLGVGKKRFLVPIEEVSRDMGEERVTVNRDSDKVVGSPNFDTNEAPAPDVQRAVLAYYGHDT